MERFEGGADLRLGPLPGVEYPVDPVPLPELREGPLAWIEFGALRGVQKTLAVLPAGLQRAGIACLARFARLVDRRHRRAAEEFLRTAYPDEDERQHSQRTLTAWKHLIRIAVESESIPKMVGEPLDDWFTVEMCERARELRESDQGCIFVTAHIGNWEMSAFPVAAIGFRPAYAIGKPPRNGPLARHISRLRERQGCRVLPRRGAAAGMPAVLAAGGIVGMLLDQRARTKPVLAPFFGRPARCDRSVGVLLRRQRVPVVFYACLRQSEGPPFRLILPEVWMPEELAGLDPAAISTRVNTVLEGMIRSHPDQYFWLHDRYRDTPRELDPDPPAGSDAVGHSEPGAPRSGAPSSGDSVSNPAAR